VTPKALSRAWLESSECVAALAAFDVDATYHAAHEAYRAARSAWMAAHEEET